MRVEEERQLEALVELLESMADKKMRPLMPVRLLTEIPKDPLPEPYVPALPAAPPPAAPPPAAQVDVFTLHLAGSHGARKSLEFNWEVPWPSVLDTLRGCFGERAVGFEYADASSNTQRVREAADFDNCVDMLDDLTNKGGRPHTDARVLHSEPFFFQYLGACRRRTPRTRVGLKGPSDVSRPDLSNAALRSDLALDVRRRHAPKS